MSVCDSLSTTHAEPVEFIFDEQLVFRREVRDTYEFMKEYVESRDPKLHNLLPTDIWFRDDKDFLPLQAADLLAGEIRMHAEKRPVLERWGSLCPNLAISKESTIWGGKELLAVSSELFDAWQKMLGFQT